MSDDGWGNDGDEWGAGGGADTNTGGGGGNEAKKGGDSGCRKCGEVCLFFFSRSPTDH